MDKLKELSKGGWHPAGDPKISRDTWKSDLKGMAMGKKKDPYEHARDHQSAPLSSMKDPDSFGPPPKHTAYYGNNASAAGSRQQGTTGGWASAVPAPSRMEQEDVEEKPKPLPEPYRRDTSGLRTDHLPKPPVRRTYGETASPVGTSSHSLPLRQSLSLPARPVTTSPPTLPPRMTEDPNEYTPPPPPTYGEATRTAHDPAAINDGAIARLSQAGVSVPGFGIGAQQQQTQVQGPAAQPRGPQLSELQQRFSRMKTASSTQAPQPAAPAPPAFAAAAKKPPPPPPPKKSGFGGDSRPPSSAGPDLPAPPPIPMSKTRVACMPMGETTTKIDWTYWVEA